MIALALLSIGLLADAPPALDARATYEAKRAQAGRDSAAHVKLALWCEQHGMTAERLRHLAIAVMNDPTNMTARGLMGLVSDQGTWRKPEEIADRAKADETLSDTRAEYQLIRANVKEDAESQSKLANWCEDHGLLAESRAHLFRVVQLDPKRDSAWKKLGYKKHGAIWLTDAQVAAEKAESQAQVKADHHWRPILEHARSGANGGTLKPLAARTLAEITDIRAVPSIMAVLGKGDAANQRVAVDLLGRLDGPAASRALAVLAAFGKSPEIKRIATETLRQRDPREYAGPLIALLRDPIKYTVKAVKTPGLPGELWVEGERFDRKRLYYSAAEPRFQLQPGDSVWYDANGLPVVNRPLGIFDMNFRGSDLFAFSSSSVSMNQSPASIQAGKSRVLQAASQANLGANGEQLVDKLVDATQANLIAQAEWSQKLAGYGANTSITPYGELGSFALYSEQFVPGSAVGRPLNPNSHIHMKVAEFAQIPVGQMEAEAKKSAAIAQTQLDRDVAEIEALNAPIHKLNEIVLGVLTQATGQNFGEKSKDWKTWFVDQIGYSLITPQVTARETVVDAVQPYQPRVQPIGFSETPISYHRISCFGAGTMIRTLDGQRPIELLEVGDLVLSQNESTGALSYQPILVVHHNPPAATLKIDLGNEAIVSSTYHRFWKTGRGWAMARELKPGDTIRILGGVATVRAIVNEKVQPVYNLDVAESRTFFVGKAGALAHDNSVPDRRSSPFDATSAD